MSQLAPFEEMVDPVETLVDTARNLEALLQLDDISAREYIEAVLHFTRPVIHWLKTPLRLRIRVLSDSVENDVNIVRETVERIARDIVMSASEYDTGGKYRRLEQSKH